MNHPENPEHPLTGMPMVLMYHSVDHYDRDPHLVTVTPERFERQLRWLQSRRLRGVSVGELLRAHAERGTRGLVGLTFDDGYADFATRAVPALVRFGFTATVFAVAGHVGQYNTWDSGPPKPLMTAGQLRAVADFGMEVASHGVRHVSLPGAPAEEVRDELQQSRFALEEIVQRPVTGFAYPYGHVSPRDVTEVRIAGYDYACAIRPDEPSRHALARTYVGERDRGLRLRAKVVRHELQWLVRV
ncbi:polysaccharide deacetylase family protein [Actinomadura vinacea]|uniref:Polysaccharide deacetylase family protein n=1 Tax=Actinomadura vinacea TaxID=115336 RepID=A0ABN3JR51_9ACTN